ncbi:MAG: ArsI/CadI family heavy metal resistance metalloenzyme [Pseudomonadota bacterium]
MKRLHIHIGIDDLQQGIQFYSSLFDTAPDKVKDDYAKWMLDDPRINFAISTHTATRGVDHLGLQVDAPEEMSALRAQFEREGLGVQHEGETQCCYAQSDKSWLHDPSGVAWETFVSTADVEAPSAATVGCDAHCATQR